MLRPLTLLLLGMTGVTCLASQTDRRASGDDYASRDFDPDYYLQGEVEYAPPAPGDGDLGKQVLLPDPPRAPIEVMGEAFLFWSDNLGNTDVGREEGWGIGARAGVAWRKLLFEEFSVDTFAFQDVYRFDADDLDFQSTEAGLGLVKQFSSLGDLLVYGHYEFLYIDADDPTGDLHTRLHSLRVGVRKDLLRKGKNRVSVGLNSRYDLDSNAAGIRRLQTSGRISWSHDLTDALQSRVSYRLSFRDYLGSSRQDWNQNVGFELGYALGTWGEIYASALYTWNDSNTATMDYESFEAGLAAGVRGEF